MMEFVEIITHIASQLNAIVYHKAKSRRYYDVMLFLDKRERDSKAKLPSLTSTTYLGTLDFKYAEENLAPFEKLETEKEWLLYIKDPENYHHKYADSEALC